jgi:hypothetical protein
MPAGGEGDGRWLLPDVLVNVLRAGDDGPGVVREVLVVCVAHCRDDLQNCVMIFFSRCGHASEIAGWIVSCRSWVVWQW